MQDKYHNVIDSVKIAVANTGAISVSLSEAESWLRVISLVAAISYTFYKFYKDVKNE